MGLGRRTAKISVRKPQGGSPIGTVLVCSAWIVGDRPIPSAAHRQMIYGAENPLLLVITVIVLTDDNIR